MQETESVLLYFIDFFIECWLLKECLSANLAPQQFFQVIHFRFKYLNN